jgi:hypothetical protein
MADILKASVALNELIAEKVMGWKKEVIAYDIECYGAPVHAWKDDKGKEMALVDQYIDNYPWRPSTEMSDCRMLMMKLAHLVGDFQTGDGFFHLTYADAADHGNEETGCNPGDGEYTDDENEKDLTPWSCHLHIGRMGEGEYPPGWDHGAKFCARGATPELAICAVALLAYGLKAPE